MSGAGTYDRRIVIRAIAPTVDELGATVLAATVAHTVWARIEQLPGAETYETDQRRTQQRTNFVIRHISGIVADMEVVHNSNVYRIESVSEYAQKGRTRRRDELLLVCSTQTYQSGAP